MALTQKLESYTSNIRLHSLGHGNVNDSGLFLTRLGCCSCRCFGARLFIHRPQREYKPVVVKLLGARQWLSIDAEPLCLCAKKHAYRQRQWRCSTSTT